MNRIFIPILKIFVSFVIIWFLFNNLDLNITIKLLIDVDKVYLTSVILVMFIQVIVANFRWSVVLKNLKIVASFKEVLKILWIGLFFNQVLPSSMGGDAVRSYFIYKKGYKISLSMFSALTDRVIGLIALVLLVFSTLFITLDLINQQAARLGVLTIAIGSILAIILFFTVEKLLKKISHFRLIRGLIDFSIESRRLIFSISPGIKLVSISLIIHILTIISIFLLSMAMQIDISLIGIIIIMPLASLLMIIPVSIAGWGVREGVMIIGLGFLSVAPESALALSLLYGILMFVISIPGFVIWLFSGYSFLHKVK